ncbi:hypothetical protein [Sphaerisporangium krabiense]|uniref:Uncharacterized protein n=1 Tax=Sphaerisporangium krabiense TaxID=763782 RepID=A0A7W8ZBM4_9ACTN|nr:hypothetical protein [Sphaerisporangium krabiense]MBB5631007.1 hypothetical protein [Sphaerisporangium krabiense]
MSVPEAAPAATGTPCAPGRHGSPGARASGDGRGRERERDAGAAREIGEGN